MLYFKEWLLLEAHQYIPPEEYEKRLKALNWKIEKNGSHRTAFAPDKIGIVTWTANNWEKNWNQIARDLLRFAKGGRGKGGYPLEFVFQNPFKIPTNFNKKTQEITKENPEKILPITKLLQNPHILTNKQIFHNDDWHSIDLADHNPDGTSIDLLLQNGNLINLPLHKSIKIK